MLIARRWSPWIVALLVVVLVIRLGSSTQQPPDRLEQLSVIRLEVPKCEISAAALSLDGSLLALGDDEGELTLRQTKDGRLQRKLRGDPPRPFPSDGSTDLPPRDPDYRRWPLVPIVFDPTGATIALASAWGLVDLTRREYSSMDIRPLGTAIEVWRIADGRKVATLDTHDVAVHILGFERGGTRIVAIDSESHAATWDVAAARKMSEFGASKFIDMKSFYNSFLGEVTIDSAGAHAASVLVYDGDDPPPPLHLRLWDCQNQTLRCVDPRERGWIGPDIFFGAVTISPDGRQVAAAASDGTIRLIDFATANPTGKFTIDPGFAQGYLAFRPDGRELIAINDEGEVRVFDVATKALIWSTKGVTGEVRALHWSGNRVLVVTGGLQVNTDIEPITLSTLVIPKH